MTTHPQALPALSLAEQRELLTFARLALEHVVHEGKALTWPPAGSAVSPRLLRPQGAFVSLHRGPMLRGCVGFIEPMRPLVAAVMENAVSAACKDFRFPPVESSELTAVDIEISVMGLLTPIVPSEVDIGRHGLVIESGGRRGLLLPQVATEHRWDRETFLRQVCLKAGLREDAWRSADTKLFAFTAQVFGEAEGNPDRQ